MISPVRFPNWLKSTGATSPLSLISAVTTCLWSEVDRCSCRWFSFSFGLLATGTPDWSAMHLLSNKASSRAVPNPAGDSLITSRLWLLFPLCRAQWPRSGAREVRHHLAREQPHRCLGLGTADHAKIHLQRGTFEAADAAVIIVDGATDLLWSA